NRLAGRAVEPCGAAPPVTVCAYCGRENDAGAQFCMDCGKPMGTSTSVKAAAAGAAVPGTRVVAPPVVAPTRPEALTCHFCGSRTPDTTIGRQDGDIRFPDDVFLSPLHAKISWEQGELVVRDLGSRNGTWVFLESAHRLADGDLLLIGSQVIRFRRLGYPGPHPPDADATRRMGSLIPSADIA